MRTTSIYCLKCPDTLEVRYIGKANNPKRRLIEHLTNLKKRSHKTNWIKGLKYANKKPILEILEVVLIEDWSDKEKFYIEQYKNAGCRLLNVMGGGEGLNFGNQTSFKKNYRARAVIGININTRDKIEFSSIKEAETALGKRINAALYNSKVYKSSANYIWFFKEDYLPELIGNKIKEVEEAKLRIRPEIVGKKTRFKKGIIVWNKGTNIVLKPYKKVNQYDKNNNLIKEWTTTKEIVESLGFNRKAIQACCRGEIKTYRKFKWKYNE